MKYTHSIWREESMSNIGQSPREQIAFTTPGSIKH